MKKWIKSNWVLIAVVLIAIFFRFWQINAYPGGLFPDEAAYGIDGRSIVNGDYQPFYERGNGREGLFMYFLALAISFFGYHPWANHLVSASFGVAAVVACYYLAKEMFDKKTAYLAAFFMAVSSYAVIMTRTAFRANTVPLFTTLTLLFTIKAFTGGTPKKRLSFAALAGLFFGLGFYTYISYRMMLPLLGGFAFFLFLAYRGNVSKVIKEYKTRVLAFALAFILAFAWIGHYWFVEHPGTFVGRAGQVSIFSPSLNNGDVVGTFIDVFQKTMLSFFTDGDLNWRHNVSGYPFLSPFISPFFALSLVAFTWAGVILLKQIWRRKLHKPTIYKALLAAWFWLMLVPEVTTAEGIPHGLRIIGTIPVIFILAARGVAWLWNRISESVYLYQRKAFYAVIFLATVFVYNFYLYFGVATSAPGYYYAFRSDLTQVSDYLNQRADKNRTYLSLDAFSVQTVDYLTTPKAQPYQLLVPENSYLVNLNHGDQIVFTQSTIFDSKKFLDFHPTAIQVEEEKNQFGETIMLVYEQK
jgi:4-amino-4-deoxy-L-arabinose transferase-like glycosyltransferase